MSDLGPQTSDLQPQKDPPQEFEPTGSEV